MVKMMTQTELLRELRPGGGRRAQPARGGCQAVVPHDYVPWSQGRKFDGLMGGDQWSESDCESRTWPARR